MLSRKEHEKHVSGLRLRLKDCAVLRIENTKNERTQTNAFEDRVRRLYFHADILGDDDIVTPSPGIIVLRDYVGAVVNPMQGFTLNAGRECIVDGTLSRYDMSWPDVGHPPVFITTTLILQATRIYKMKDGNLLFDDRHV